MIRQIWDDINWFRLRRNSPVNIRSIVRLATDIEKPLKKYGCFDASDFDEDELNNLSQDLISLRSKINTISLLFLRLIKTGFDDTDDNQLRAYRQIQSAFSKLFDNLQRLEREDLKKGVMLNHATIYISVIDTILYGLIYHSLKDAIESSKISGEDFSLELWRATSFSFDVFRYQLTGEPDSTKGENITYSELKENKQETATKDFEKKMQNVKDAEGILKEVLGSDISD